MRMALKDSHVDNLVPSWLGRIRKCGPGGGVS